MGKLADFFFRVLSSDVVTSDVVMPVRNTAQIEVEEAVTCSNEEQTNNVSTLSLPDEIENKDLDANVSDDLKFDWTAKIDSSIKSFQVLGACSRRGYIDDFVRAGTPLAVNVRGANVWVIRSGYRTIGIFPPKIASDYLSLPENERYQYVIVVRDVNLNDKYGQCFVQPFIAKHANDGVEN